MSKIEINRWKESAGESWINNEESVKKNGAFYFWITTEQKEYLEDHIDEIDDWCERTIGEIPHTITFEEDWVECEDGFDCECYFK